MKENINGFKEWFKLARPPFWPWLLQFSTVIVTGGGIIVQAIFAARSVSSLADKDYNMAIINLVIVLAIEIVRLIAWDINYRNTSVLVGKSYMGIQEKIFNKIINGKDNNFKNISKEKMLNIFHADALDVAAFSDDICNKFRFLIAVVLIVVYVMRVNLYVALAIIFIIVTNYIILEKLNKKLEIAQKNRKKTIDDESERFSEVVQSRNILDDLNIVDKIKQRYLDSSKKYVKAKRNYEVKLSYIDNYFKIYYKILVFILSIVMIFILKNNLVSFAVYLVLISYLSDSITNSNDFLAILTSLKNAYVATNRVNIILNFDDNFPIEFGNVDKDEINGEIDFIKVSYDANERIEGLNDIRNISFNIKSNEKVLFYGPRSCGKRTIFYLLRRLIKAQSGDVYIDKIKAENFSNKVYRTNVNYLTTKPYFFEDSIINNLKIVHNDFEKIKSLFKDLGIYQTINSLPDKFKTNILSLPEKEKYLIGLVRLLLMNSEIIIFYEFPNYLSQSDKDIIKEIIKKLDNKTVLIFSANDDCLNIVDKVYKIERGKIEHETRIN